MVERTVNTLQLPALAWLNARDEAEDVQKAARVDSPATQPNRSPAPQPASILLLGSPLAVPSPIAMECTSSTPSERCVSYQLSPRPLS